MRGWPVRGIGPGAKPLAAYNSISLNDRTGDVRIEINSEYRYDIAPIIPNSLTLKGALFVDAGNVFGGNRRITSVIQVDHTNHISKQFLIVINMSCTIG